jgi:hypothetical protein
MSESSLRVAIERFVKDLADEAERHEASGNREVGIIKRAISERLEQVLVDEIERGSGRRPS